MIRLFAALAIPPAIWGAIAPLRQGVRGARWHEPERLHLTLRFFGEIDEALAEDLDMELAAVTSPAFDLRLAGVGAFETRRVVNHLWLGVEPNSELLQLHKRCESAARRAGAKPDVRSWRPHVTLAYLSGADPLTVAAWISTHNLSRPPPWSVTSFGLYSSWRAGRGQTYRLEREYPFTPRRDPSAHPGKSSPEPPRGWSREPP